MSDRKFAGDAWICIANYRKSKKQCLRVMMNSDNVSCTWFVLLVIPKFFRLGILIEDYWVELLFGAIPLAYLINHMALDLYRIDRLILRIGLHTGTILVLIGLLAAIIESFMPQGTPTTLWIAIGFVALYRPVQHLGLRLLPGTSSTHTYHALHAAATKL